MLPWQSCVFAAVLLLPLITYQKDVVTKFLMFEARVFVAASFIVLAFKAESNVGGAGEQPVISTLTILIMSLPPPPPGGSTAPLYGGSGVGPNTGMGLVFQCTPTSNASQRHSSM